MAIYTFKRTELKYLITKEQYHTLLEEFEGKVALDQYGQTTIQSLYLDTPNSLLIRRSIEKPIYKEKIRIRSYGVAKPNQQVFFELKKKYDKVVFKRRIQITEEECFEWLQTKSNKFDSQISKEIDYFINFYEGIQPSLLLIYDRLAYTTCVSDLRITFDSNIRYRDYDLSLQKGLYGESILDDNYLIMEIKSATAFPLWLVRILSKHKIYKTSFSKYGTAYKKILKEQGEQQHVV